MGLDLFKNLERDDFEDNNLLIDESNDVCYVLVNDQIFDKEVVIAASYSIEQFAYCIIDKKENFFVVALYPTKNGNLETIGYEFNNRLINHSYYINTLKRTKKIKENILNETFSQLNRIDDEVNEKLVDDELDDLSIAWEDKYDDEFVDENIDSMIDEIDDDDDFDFDDPEGIMKPWDESQSVENEMDSVDPEEGGSGDDNFDFDDPEGIMVPWDEKYGKKNKKSKEDS
ncbi:MAG: hypothetical protein ACOCP4_06080 [Candidatus Woesearchaeota archaeon]